MRKYLALFMASMTLIFALAACGQKDISGDYTATVKMSDINDAAEKADDAITKGFMENMNVTLKMNLDKKNYSISLDSDKLISDVKQYATDHFDEIVDEALKQQNMDKSQITDDLAKKAGYDSAQAFYDELKNQMLKAMEDAMKKEVAKGIDTNSKGSYKVAGGKVIFAEGGSKLGLGQGQINKDGSITIKISDSQLKIDHIDLVKNN